MRVSNDKHPVRQSTVDRLDAFEKEQQVLNPILWWEVVVLMPVVLLYVLARTYMVAEVFVSLRRMPRGVYDTFEVADMLPHW